jgi:hypothetical protein
LEDSHNCLAFSHIAQFSHHMSKAFLFLKPSRFGLQKLCKEASQFLGEVRLAAIEQPRSTSE